MRQATLARSAARVVWIAALSIAAPVAAQGALTEQRTLAPTSSPMGSQTGFAVAIDGDHALVGMPGIAAASGAVYAFHRDAGGNWTGPDTVADPDSATTSDQFGTAIAISGDVAVIGAPGHATGTGAAWRFTFDGTSWTGATSLTRPSGTPPRFGSAVAISSSFIAVGAPADAAAAGVVVYAFDGSGGTLVHSPGSDGDRFGSSVALGGDVAGHVLVVGAPMAARAYGFLESGGAWNPAPRAMFESGTTGDQLGASVALSPDGSVLALAAPNTSAGGSVYLVRRMTVPGSWDDFAAATVLRGHTTDGTDHFGSALAMDGRYLVVGARLDDASTPAMDAGSLFLFDVMGAPVEMARYELSAPMPTDNLGASVALSGQTILGGAPRPGATNGFAAVFGFPLAGGADCTTRPAACATGHCVDGVCCDDVCGGGDTNDCVACTMALTGTSDGTCGAVTGGSSCTACGMTGTCSGTMCTVGGSCDTGPAPGDDAGGPGTDGGGGMDAAVSGPRAHVSGCKCEVGAHAPGAPAALVALLVGVGIALRRRVRPKEAC